MPPCRQRQRLAPRSPVNQRPPWLSILDQDALAKVMDKLAGAGMRSGYRFDKQTRNVLTFRTTGTRKCIFNETHQSNNFGCVLTREGDIAFKCHGSECEGKVKIIGRWKALDLQSACDFTALSASQLMAFDPSIPARAEAIVVEQNPDCVSKAGKLMWNEMDGYRDLARFQVQYLSHFFKHVTCSKPEVLQVWYDIDGRLAKFTRRTFADTQQVVRSAGAMAFTNWHVSPNKAAFNGYCSEMNRGLVPEDRFNLLVGSRPFEVKFPFALPSQSAIPAGSFDWSVLS